MLSSKFSAASLRFFCPVVLFGLTALGLAQTAPPSPNTPVAPQATDAQTPPPYLLGPEDVVTVTVIGHTELSGDLTVATDGRVNLFGAGEVAAQGKSLTEFTAAVVKQLQTNKLVGLLHPVVSCSLKTARLQRVYVLGQVKTPGVYDAKQGWRISEAIAAAGGLISDFQGLATGGTQLQLGDYTVSLLHASGGAALEVPLVDALRGASDKDLPVSPGDVVTVNSVSLFTIYVNGNVVKPGIYQIRRDDPDVMKAIAMAGGFTPMASTAHVKVTNPDGTSEVVDLSAAVQNGADFKGPKVVAGTLILVPELQSKVSVLGLVKAPGTYPMPDGKVVRLNDAIGYAQGYDTKRARLSLVAVVTQEDGKNVRHVYNFGNYLRKGDLSMNPIIPPNAMVFVPETNSPDWSDVFNGVGGLGTVFLGLHAF